MVGEISTEHKSFERLYVVLGMHRSGTSALSRALKIFNIAHGDNLIEAADDNPRGFWESHDVVNINDKVLAVNKLYWDSLGDFSDMNLSSGAMQPLLEEAVTLIRKKLECNHQWCFKDPRTIRVLPFWLKVFDILSIQPQFLVVIRNPLDVAQSLKKRNNFAVEKSLLLWFFHYYPFLPLLLNKSVCVVDYNSMLSSPETCFKRIGNHFDLVPNQIELNDYMNQFLDSNLCHSNTSLNQFIASDTLSVIKELYQAFVSIANEKMSFDDFIKNGWKNIISSNEIIISIHSQILQVFQSDMFACNNDFIRLQNEINELGNKINSLNRTIAYQENYIINLENSRSWKITKPLRNISEKLKLLFKPTIESM